MRKYILIFSMLCLCGCAALQDIAEHPAEYTTGSQETISAVNTLTGGMGIPAGVGIALGYAAHILRVMYKRKKGCKNL